MILITGASRGIGKYLLERFIEKGETIRGTFYSTSKDPKISKYLDYVNIRNSNEIYEWVGNIFDYMEKSSDDKLILINCAGINQNMMAHKADLGEWMDIIKVNLIGTFKLISSVLPFMRNNGYGRIINFGSVVAKIGVPGTSAYAASKSGLWGMTRAIAAENANKGITINTINLGYFNIGMISEVPEKYRVKIKERISCGKFGDPEMIWKTVNFIIENDYLNGAEIDLNGGII